MAITYPRDLPDYLLQECTFDLLEGVAAAAYAGGARINRSQTTDPVWRARIQTIPFWLYNREDEQIWSAWNRSMRGGLKTFIAYDKKRENPLAYLDAQAPGDIKAGWSGTVSVASIGQAGQISLSGAPTGYQAKAGDRLTLLQNGKRGYFEILEDATGSSLSLTVAPFINPFFTSAAAAVLWRPRAEFMIDWQSWQARGVATPEPISFEAYQVL